MLSEDKRFDVCVIGSGPAGITVALTLEARGHTVLLLEAGPENYDEKSQEFFRGEIIGENTFDMESMRVRCFGGASTVWGGFCRQFDEWDFQTKLPGIDTAWPITKRELDPYLDKARDILEIACFQKNESYGDDLLLLHWRYSPRVNFGSKYHDAIKRSRHLTLSLNSYVTNLFVVDGRVDAIEVRDPSNKLYTARAKQYVLCAGGIENSRILLWANRQNEGRLIPQFDALGKYWMDHPHYSIGEALLYNDLPFELDRKGRAYIAPSAKALRNKRILNCALRLEPTNYAGAKKLVGEIACVAPSIGRWAAKRLEKNLVCGVGVRAAWEQAPVADNQIRLSSRLDAAGIPRPELHYRKTELELRTVRESFMLFGRYLADNNLGRARFLPWVLDRGGYPDDDEKGGYHHLGGTRMSIDPRKGVVDAECKLHDVHNLYIGGSSVFPSGGHANPTFTIVQLALRLGDQLHNVISGKAV